MENLKIINISEAKWIFKNCLLESYRETPSLRIRADLMTIELLQGRLGDGLQEE